jgi:hypothetical protein
MWRGNSHIRQSRHTLHFLTFACSGFEALELTWKRLFCRITTPRLETLPIRLFKQLTFSVPPAVYEYNRIPEVR